MLFTDIIFVPFLIVTFLLFSLARKSLRLQLLVLLTASYIFYGWWDARFLILLVFTSLFDYCLGKRIYEAPDHYKKKIYVILSLLCNLGVLGYFKYCNFFISSLNSLLIKFGAGKGFPALNIILPIGISFYTFQSLSYTMDIYFGVSKPADSPLKFLVAIAAFPHLVAGPILRAKYFLGQLNDNLFAKSNHDGIFYILYGLLKKMFLADLLGHYVVDKVFSSSLAQFTSLELIFAVYCYAFQIFFDFSAYSDIAIGLAKIFGIEFPINFKFPYTSQNPREFWTKWHITLSTWLKDYLYIPLGGNRCSRLFNIRNLLIVMLLGGLWHGANWTFVVWGFLHGLYLVVYSFRPKKNSLYDALPGFIKTFLFFNLVCFAWVFFRSPTIGFAFEYLKNIFRFSGGFSHFTYLTAGLLLGASVFVHYLLEPNLKAISGLFLKLHWSFYTILLYAFFVFVAFSGEKGIAHQAFIYFQF